jgi:hypothetical protein
MECFSPIRLERTLNAPVIARSAFRTRSKHPRRASVRLLLSILLVLLLLPDWSGYERLDLLQPDGTMTARRVRLAADPRVTHTGALTYLGGVELRSGDPAFGGFSALAVTGDQFTLLSDGGSVVRFRMGADWQPRGVRFGTLPGGPWTGWRKHDRDSESLVVDPMTNRAWVAFENWNMVWRYDAALTRAQAGATPPLMRHWSNGLGAETMVKRRDDRFVIISEKIRADRRGGRRALIFPGDPVTTRARAERFTYMPQRGFDPADGTELPDGRVVVLERAFRFPFTWGNRLAIVDRDAIRPGARVRGRTLAMLEAPLIHDNFEGVAAVREGRDTILWLVSDDNQFPLQRTLLLKFRLDPDMRRGPRPPGPRASQPR